MHTVNKHMIDILIMLRDNDCDVILPRRARDSQPKNEGKIENIIHCENVCQETLTGVGWRQSGVAAFAEAAAAL